MCSGSPERIHGAVLGRSMRMSPLNIGKSIVSVSLVGMMVCRRSAEV